MTGPETPTEDIEFASPHPKFHYALGIMLSERPKGVLMMARGFNVDRKLRSKIAQNVDIMQSRYGEDWEFVKGVIKLCLSYIEGPFIIDSMETHRERRKWIIKLERKYPKTQFNLIFNRNKVSRHNIGVTFGAIEALEMLFEDSDVPIQLQQLLDAVSVIKGPLNHVEEKLETDQTVIADLMEEPSIAKRTTADIIEEIKERRNELIAQKHGLKQDSKVEQDPQVEPSLEEGVDEYDTLEARTKIAYPVLAEILARKTIDFLINYKEGDEN